MRYLIQVADDFERNMAVMWVCGSVETPGNLECIAQVPGVADVLVRQLQPDVDASYIEGAIQTIICLAQGHALSQEVIGSTPGAIDALVVLLQYTGSDSGGSSSSSSSSSSDSDSMDDDLWGSSSSSSKAIPCQAAAALAVLIRHSHTNLRVAAHSCCLHGGLARLLNTSKRPGRLTAAEICSLVLVEMPSKAEEFGDTLLMVNGLIACIVDPIAVPNLVRFAAVALLVVIGVERFGALVAQADSNFNMYPSTCLVPFV